MAVKGDEPMPLFLPTTCSSAVLCRDPHSHQPTPLPRHPTPPFLSQPQPFPLSHPAPCRPLVPPFPPQLHKVLDYRTVDELGLRPEQLDLTRKPAIAPLKLTVVEDKSRGRGGDDSDQRTINVELGVNMRVHEATPPRTNSDKP